MLKERDIPEAATSLRAAAKCAASAAGLGSAGPAFGGAPAPAGSAAAAPAAANQEPSKRARQRPERIRHFSKLVRKFKTPGDASIGEAPRGAKKTSKHIGGAAVSIELAKDLDAGGAGADHCFGDAKEQPVFDDARDGDEAQREVFGIWN